MSDKLYDYWGVPIITSNDDEIMEVFEDVLRAEDYILKWDKTNGAKPYGPSDVGLKSLFSPDEETVEKWRTKGLLPTLGEALGEDDVILLEEYLPKLFNTIIEPDKNLGNAIYTLVVLIRSYRYAEMERKVFEKQFDIYKKTKDEKGDGRDKKIEQLREKIKDIIGLSGNKTPQGAVISPQMRDNIIPALEELYNNPNKYMLKNPKYIISKTPILTYLESLRLLKKSDTIKEFWAKV